MGNPAYSPEVTCYPKHLLSHGTFLHILQQIIKFSCIFCRNKAYYACIFISKPSLPLSAYRDGAVKIFFLDVGLLAAKAGLDAETVLHGNRIFQEFKGALAEQYVQQELRTATETETCYWATEDSRTEVDFVIQHRMSVIPVEVKAERNLKAKSLKTYCERYRPEIAVRCSMSEHHTQRVELPESAAGYTLIDLPLYAAGQLPAACRNGQG